MIKRLLSTKLFINSQAYIGGTFITSLIPFILLPILTRYLSPPDYAIVAMFQILSSILYPVVSLSIHGAITVKYFDKNKINLPNYIGNCLLIACINTLLISSIIYVFSGPISNISMFPKGWLWSPLLFSFSQSIVMLVLTLWLIQSKAISHTLFQILLSLCNLGFSILLVVMLKRKWEGRIEAQLITTVIFAVIGFIYICRKRLVNFSFNRTYFKSALRYGVPLIPHEMGGLLMAYIDRFFLMNMKGAADTGIYTVGYQVASVMGVIALSFNKAYIPWLFEKIKLNNFLVNLKVVKFTYCYFAVILIVAIAYSLIASWALKFIVGKDFTGAGSYVMWFSISSAFMGMYYMVSNYLLFAEKTHMLAAATFFIAIVNAILTFLLVRGNGVVGAAQSTLLTNLLYFLLVWFLSSRFYKMPWNLKNKEVVTL